MLPTFVIGLREGLEAALIVGIIAAFLKRQGRRDLLRWVYVGVAAAIGLCLAVGAALEVLSRDLPQAQQEGLETIVGLLAVAMVTYMVIWMKRHSRELKGTLEHAAADALATGSGRAGSALVVMAFLAVLREGFETVVFLLAAFNETGNGAGPIAGAILGILVAVGLGWGIYRGGVRLNLSKFFRATGLVLVLVAAGLLVTALHTAHEAGWLTIGQTQVLDLSWLVQPGTVRASLLTGILGLQPYPVAIEVAGWLLYFIPVGCYVAWPAGRGLGRRAQGRLALAGGALCALATLTLVLLAPSTPHFPATATPSGAARVLSISGAQASVHLPGRPARPMHRAGTAVVGGALTTSYAATSTGPGRTRSLPVTAIARLDGGRLPIGVTGSGRMPVTFRTATTTTVDVAPHGGRIVGVRTRTVRTATVRAPIGAVPLDRPVSTTTSTWPAGTEAAAAAAARDDAATAADRASALTVAWITGIAAVLLLIAAAERLRPRRPAPTPEEIDLTSPSELARA